MIKRERIIIAGIILFIFILSFWLYKIDFSQGKDINYGVTFSQKYANELNLNWKELYLAILNDLKVKKLRLIAYWDLIESEKDKYDFQDLDWQLEQAESEQAEVILSIGHRLPRWPECHWPDWSYQFNQEEREAQILKLLEEIVERYKNNQIIKAWQVENEPFLKVFGECPKPDNKFYKQEIELVRSLDDRPIVVTESGELSTWLRAAQLADYIGTSVYRITWNKRWGYFYYPLPPAYYYLKTQLIKLLSPVKDVIITEMQMEPWLGMPVLLTPLAEQYHSMDLKLFRKNLQYIKKAGLSPVYFWGVEWWYWLGKQGDETIWQAAREIWLKT